MNRIITTGKILAVLTIITGIVHEVMTFHPMIAESMQGLDAVWQRTFTCFSLGCGVLPIMGGLLFFMLSGRVERHEFLTAPLIAIGIFAAGNGIIAVCYMLTNLFAWVVLGLGLGLFFTATAIRSRHRKQ